MQFIYLMAGGMIIYATFEIAQPAVFWIIAIPVALLTLSLAFVKVQDQPFTKFLTSAAFFFVKPKKRYWYKDPKDEKFEEETKPERELPKEKSTPEKKVEKSELEKLAGLISTEPTEEIVKKQNITMPETPTKDKKTSNQVSEPIEDIFNQ